MEQPHNHLLVPERLQIQKMLTNMKARVDRETGALAIAPTAAQASKCKLFFLSKGLVFVFAKIMDFINSGGKQRPIFHHVIENQLMINDFAG